MQSSAVLKVIAAGTAALAMAACSAGEVKAPDSVGGLTKAQVEAIVREYLLREPGIVYEMVAASEKQEQARQVSLAEGSWDKLLASSKDDPSLGPKDAPITIIEFSDYECGVCKMAVPWVMAQADDRRGDIRVIVKESAWKGPGSEPAARAALAAHKQGKYREMHVALMAAPPTAYDPENLEIIAKSVGLDIARWKKDMVSDETTQRIKRTEQEFRDSGVAGTPAFLINGKFVGGFGEDQLNSLVEATRQMIKAK